MSVTIRAMTNDEFQLFCQWSVANHARELMDELRISQEEAEKEAIAELAAMLPHGIRTEHNDLMTIVAEGENAGFIWTLYEQFEGRKQCFICDFTIWESKRRKGYGAAALYLAERNAADSSCQETVLFVRKDNVAASALYEKCGYHVLRQEGSGAYRIKSLVQF